MPPYIPAFIAGAFVLLLTPVIRRAAFLVGAVDEPRGPRKIHREPKALLGGVGVGLAVVVGLLVAVAFGWLPGEHVSVKNAVGLAIAVAIITVGGALDDRFNLRPHQQVIFPLLASAVVVASGIGIDYVTNPFGGQLRLDGWEVTALWWRGLPYRVTLPSDLLTVAWLMTLSYATKVADGLDGLVSGLAVLGSLVVGVTALIAVTVQPDTAMVSLVVGAAFLGFLVYNYHPASIFLGESGSVLAGFLLGALAIVSGGKVAVALLVLSLPLADLLVTVTRRSLAGRSPFAADRLHLHHRLLDAGLTQREVAWLIWLVAAATGVVALAIGHWHWSSAVALGFSLAVGGAAVWLTRRRWMRTGKIK
jgi:UDP-GlcNAc:undecaprenyl-phosphate GlcNAc-1-phosphate transferase